MTLMMVNVSPRHHVRIKMNIIIMVSVFQMTLRTVGDMPIHVHPTCLDGKMAHVY